MLLCLQVRKVRRVLLYYCYQQPLDGVHRSHAAAVSNPHNDNLDISVHLSILSRCGTWPTITFTSAPFPLLSP